MFLSNLSSMKRIYILFAILILFLSGCVGNVLNNRIDDYVKQSEELGLIKLYNVSELMNSLTVTEGVCNVWVCVNKTVPKSIFDWLFGTGFDPSLLGGNCSYYILKSRGDFDAFYNASLEDESYHPRPFTFGLGPYFGDFNEGNLYCNSSLGYAEKIIRGTDDLYIITGLIPQRSACYLTHSVIPVFILYHNGTIPKEDNSYVLAEKVHGLGPTIIFSEALPDVKDPKNVDRIVKQVKTLRNKCPRQGAWCYVGLSITMNLTEMEPLLERLESDPSFKNAVDVIGFGIDTRYAEKMGGCSGAYLLTQALMIAKNITITYSRPTFIYYVFINTSDPCWTDYSVREFYTLLMGGNDAFAESGVLGMVVQPFTEDSPIGDCHTCGLTYYKTTQSGFLKENNPAFSMFFSYCQEFYKKKMYQLVMFSTDGLIDTCGMYRPQPIYKYYHKRNQTIGRYVPLKEMTIKDKDKEIYRCNACVVPYSFKEFPRYLKNFHTANFPKDKCESGNDPVLQAIEFFADRYDMDQYFLKAIIGLHHSRYTGKGYEPYKVEFCSQYKCYNGVTLSNNGWKLPNAPVETIIHLALQDPDNNYTTQLKNWEDLRLRYNGANKNLPCYFLCDPESKVGTKTPLCIPYRFGLMFVKYPPVKPFLEHNLDLGDRPEHIKMCGDEEFNPYDPADNICAASAFFGLYSFPEAEKVYNTMIKDLQPDEGLKDNEKEVDKLMTISILAYRHYFDKLGLFKTLYIEKWQRLLSEIDEAKVKGEDEYCEMKDATDPYKVLCCKKEMTSNGTTWVYDDAFHVCGQKLRFLHFLTNFYATCSSHCDANRGCGSERYERACGDKDGSLVWGEIMNTMNVLSAYIDSYKECGGCVKEEWNENLCERIEEITGECPKECHAQKYC